MTDFHRFSGTSSYLSDPSLEAAVNCALALQKPLLVRGEPGTGKTLLAEALAASLDSELIRWSIKSTTKAEEGLYTYDAVSRLYSYVRTNLLEEGLMPRDLIDVQAFIWSVVQK